MRRYPDLYRVSRKVQRHVFRAVDHYHRHHLQRASWRGDWIALRYGRAGVFAAIVVMLHVIAPRQPMAAAMEVVCDPDIDGGTRIDNPDAVVPVPHLTAVRMLVAITSRDYEMAWDLFAPTYPRYWPRAKANEQGRGVFAVALSMSHDHLQRRMTSRQP